VAWWGASSFENDIAVEWFFLLEEAVDPGAVIAAALDDALSESDHIDLSVACEAIAAAELSASCAGQPPERLPDPVHRWVGTHPHAPHGVEIALAIEAVTRVRTESRLRDQWDEPAEGADDEWLGQVDDLIARLGRSGTGDPATLSP